MANIFQIVFAAAACASLVACAPSDMVLSMNVWEGSADGTPVNVTLYYEVLCPYCYGFIMDKLIPTWEKVKDSGLMTVEMRPYGNARESLEGGKWKFTCQHGEAECEGNILQACIINYYPDTTKQLEIIKCVEKDFYQSKNWQMTLQKCSSTGVDVEKVSVCAKGKEGNDLEHNFAVLTGPHKGVPWPLLDGKWSEAPYDDLLKAVCNAYKGTPPSVCNTY